MTDLNSKIENAKREVASLKQQIDNTQKSQFDATLVQSMRNAGMTPAGLRMPPSALKSRRSLKGHFGKVIACHWGGDSRTLVSASQDGNVLVWNAFTSNKTAAIPLKSQYVMAVGIEQTNMQMIACGGLDNLCTVYKIAQPDVAMEMASHDGFLSCCRFISSREILTSSGDSTCIKWDVEKQRPVSTFAEHTADAMFLSIKDANTFASCSVDQTIKLWDVRAPQASVQTFRGHTSDINGIEFVPASEGNCFATCSQDNTVRLWDLRAYNELARFHTGQAPPQPKTNEDDGPFDCMTSLAVSRSGRLIFCGHTEGNILVFDTLSDKTTPAFNLSNAHERSASCVGVSPYGDALASGGWDSLVKIWA